MSVNIDERIAALEARVAALEGVTVKQVAMAVAEPVKSVAKKVAAAKEKPVVAAGDEPAASEYRLTAIDATLCQARKEPPMAGASEGWDKRYTPAVFRERQCTRKPVDGSELCALCTKCQEKETDEGTFKKWHGLVTEEPLAHSHMPGSEWFAAKCKWVGGEVAASPPKVTTAAAAEKAAAKAAAAEAKAAEKAAATAAKEAEKAAAKAAKPKEVKPKSKETKPTKEKEVKEEVVADTEAKPLDGDYELLMFEDGEQRFVKNGNVYELNELTQEPADYIGRMTGTKEAGDLGVDADAEEELESDSE